MPIPQRYRVNPIDLQPNVAVGFSFPLNGPAVFNSTYTTKEQVKYNLLNLMLTNKGERIENPDFGTNLKRFVFELVTDNNIQAVKDIVVKEITNYVPEVALDSIQVSSTPDLNFVEISINYRMKLSGDKDNITINFE